MQYLLLIYGNEEAFSKMSKAEQDGILKEYGDYTKSIAQSGHYRGGGEQKGAHPPAAPCAMPARSCGHGDHGSERLGRHWGENRANNRFSHNHVARQGNGVYCQARKAMRALRPRPVIGGTRPGPERA